jgi:hypothetical protein
MAFQSSSSYPAMAMSFENIRNLPQSHQVSADAC